MYKPEFRYDSEVESAKLCKQIMRQFENVMNEVYLSLKLPESKPLFEIQRDDGE